MDITQIICAVLSAFSAILVAWITHTTKAFAKKADDQAELRAKEGRLQLKMIHANSKLTIGCAMALKNGHANGEVEEGLKAVQEAEGEYQTFLEGIAIDAVKKG